MSIEYSPGRRPNPRAQIRIERPRGPEQEDRRIREVAGCVEADVAKGRTEEALKKIGIHFNKTRLVYDRLRRSGDLDENGMFHGRPLITHESRIHGGVYLGEGTREAIVVDEKYGKLSETYNAFLVDRKEAMESGELAHFKDHILQDVFHYVLDLIPYNSEVADNLEEHVGQDGKIALDAYINFKGGVCRHQALLVAYYLERLIDERKIGGEVKIERNTTGFGGHAWVQYTTANGTEVIIDVAQRYIGTLEDRKNQKWYYERPEAKTRAA